MPKWLMALHPERPCGSSPRPQVPTCPKSSPGARRGSRAHADIGPSVQQADRMILTFTLLLAYLIALLVILHPPFHR